MIYDLEINDQSVGWFFSIVGAGVGGWRHLGHFIDRDQF